MEPVKESDYVMDGEKYNEATRHNLNAIEIQHSHYNAQFLTDKFTQRVFPLNAIPRAVKKPIILIGSGIGLDRAGPLLKNWKSDVVCSGSQASTLCYYEKPPTFICIIDPRDDGEGLLKVDNWVTKNSVLVVHPGVSPKLLKNWPNRFVLYRKQDTGNDYYENEQKWGYSERLVDEKGNTQMVRTLIPDLIPSLASSLPVELWIAYVLGYYPIFLVGCEHASDRFTQWNYVHKEWQSVGRAGYVGAGNAIADTGVMSDKLILFYKLAFIECWRILQNGEGAEVIDTSDKDSALSEFPKAQIEDVIESEGKLNAKVQGWQRDRRIESAELYMARRNMYVINTSQGPHIAKMQIPKDKVMDELIKRMEHLVSQKLPVDIPANTKRISRQIKETSNAN